MIMDRELFNKRYYEYYEVILPQREKQNKISHQKVSDCNNYTIIYYGKMKEAQMNNDKEAEQKWSDELNRTIKELHKNKEMLKQIKEVNDKDKSVIETRVEEMKKDPELNIALLKRYNRANKRMEKEKEKIESFAQLLEQNPALNNSFKGMLRAKSEIKKINEKIGELEARAKDSKIGLIEKEKIANEIAEYRNKNANLQEKLQNNREVLKSYLEKHNLNFNIEDIDEMSNKGFRNNGVMLKDKDGKTILDENGKPVPDIDVQKTLGNQIKGIEKNIKYNEKSKEKVIKELSDIADAREYVDEEMYENIKGNLPANVVKAPWYKKIGNLMKKIKRTILRDKDDKDNNYNNEEQEEITVNNKNVNNAWRGNLKVEREVMNNKEKELNVQSRKEVRREIREEERGE